MLEYQFSEKRKRMLVFQTLFPIKWKDAKERRVIEKEKKKE